MKRKIEKSRSKWLFDFLPDETWLHIASYLNLSSLQQLVKARIKVNGVDSRGNLALLIKPLISSLDTDPFKLFDDFLNSSYCMRCSEKAHRILWKRSNQTKDHVPVCKNCIKPFHHFPRQFSHSKIGHDLPLDGFGWIPARLVVRLFGTDMTGLYQLSDRTYMRCTTDAWNSRNTPFTEEPFFYLHDILRYHSIR